MMPQLMSGTEKLLHISQNTGGGINLVAATEKKMCMGTFSHSFYREKNSLPGFM